MAHKISLIASDLDGTLLLNGAQSLQADTCDLIRQLGTRGILFFAASGRQYTSLLKLFAPVKHSIGYICENGCVSFYRGEMISQETMSDADGHALIDALFAEPGYEVLVSGKKSCYVQPKDPAFEKFMREVVGFDVTCVENLQNNEEPYTKISAWHENIIADASRWKALFDERFTVQSAGNDWLDFMPKGVNKWTAFKKMIDRMDIDAEDCVFFGDSDNDRQLLENVGCPITMTTAVEEIRPLGKFQTDTVENALRSILEGDGFHW